MNYFDNYEQNNKIPYDDIPINRSNSKRRRKMTKSLRTNKIMAIFMAVLVVLNVILCYNCVYFIKHSRSKVINQYTIEISSDGASSSSEIASIYKTEAYLTSICVAAGGTCKDETTFYNSTAQRGSGVIYKIEEEKNTAYFITCYHVVGGNEDKVWIMPATATSPIAVSVVAYSAHYDIAVLKLESDDLEGDLAGCKPIKTYDSTYVSMGENVIAIGNSLANGLSITEGDVSNVNVLVRISGNNFYTRTIQTSAEINPGNSGGGLFNAKGEFIGLVNAKKHSTSSGSETVTVVGTAYAIPSNLVIGIADSLIKTKNKPIQINLGAEFAYDSSINKVIEYVSYNDIYKPIENYVVYIKSIVAGSVADDNLDLNDGVLNVNDVIKSIEFYVLENGQTVAKHVDMYNIYVFEDYSFSIIKGSVVTFHIENGDTEKIVKIVASDTLTVTD